LSDDGQRQKYDRSKLNTAAQIFNGEAAMHLPLVMLTTLTLPPKATLTINTGKQIEGGTMDAHLLHLHGQVDLVRAHKQLKYQTNQVRR
jgi:hypothetical protein